MGKQERITNELDAVWSLPDDQLADFLGKLWGTDGCVYLKKSRNRTHGVLEWHNYIQKSCSGNATIADKIWCLGVEVKDSNICIQW